MNLTIFFRCFSKKSPEFTDRNKHKNELLRNWDKVSAQLEKAGVKPPKFKVAAGILTDKPPVVDHDPLSVKPNRILDEAPTTKGTSLITGQTLSELLKKEEHIFPPALSQLTAVGERTGNMEEMFQSIATYYEEEFDGVVAALSSIIEPLMIVIIGAIIGVLMIALYMPIFSIGQAVG